MREVMKQMRESALAAMFDDEDWDKSAGVPMAWVELEGNPKQFRDWMDEALRAALAAMPGEDAAWNEAIEAAAKMVEQQQLHSDFALSHDNGEKMMADKLRTRLRRPA